ncbi:hypothetical protein BGX28_003405 [Mortierella sp. GBA30]|nr:hypothetical protein BGX28_003405 [Mortierella sp. GBA30]
MRVNVACGLWREISFMDIEQEHFILTHDHQEALLANSQWIRELIIKAAYAPALCLAGPRSSCSNLRSLECDLVHEQNAYSMAIAALLDRNPQLENLTLRLREEDPGMYLYEMPQDTEGIVGLVSTLRRLSSLKELTIETAGPFASMDLSFFLPNLPESLEIFVYEDQDAQGYAMDSMFDFQDFGGLEWPDIYPCVKVIRFGQWIGSDVVSALQPFMVRCPLLETLDLPTMSGGLLTITFEEAGVHCPKLKNLLVMGDLEFEEEDLLSLIDAVPAMESLDLACSCPTTGIFVSQMIPRWANTLTALSIGVGVVVESSDIQLLLCSCPSLLTFWMIAPLTRPWRIEPHYSALKLSDLVQSQWACLGLLYLSIAFHDERVEQKTLKLHKKQEARTRDLIKQAYERLGKLTQLEQLRLAWGRPFREEVDGNRMALFKTPPLVHMDMSVDSGLPKLKGLVNLEMLLVRDLAKVSIGEQEKEWILKSWPKLCMIDALDKSLGHWLQTKKFGRIV